MSEIKNLRQTEALQEWAANNYVGTIMAVPAFGKMWCFFKALYIALEGGKMQRGNTTWFFAETLERERDLRREAVNYSLAFGRNPFNDFDIQFKTYQSGATGDRVMDAYDEVDVALSEVYSRIFFSSPARVKLALTATCESTSTVYKSKIAETLHGEVRQDDSLTSSRLVTDNINKGQLLEVVCPVIYRYPTSKAIEDGLVVPYQTFVIEHSLDATHKYMKPWKKSNYFVSERAAYDTWNNMRTDYTKSPFLKKMAGGHMTRLLWTSKSKAKVAKALLEQVEGNSIIFGLTLDFIESITPNTVRPKGIDYVSQFNQGLIKDIGSVKKLERGTTLTNLNNILMVSWHSTSSSFLQRLGRGLREGLNKEIANLYLFKTVNTLESDRWFETINKVLDAKGNIIEEIDLNIQGIISSQEILRKQVIK